MSFGVFSRLSRYSTKNTKPSETLRPATSESNTERWRFGAIGTRGTSAASTIRMLVALRSLEMPASFVRCIRFS